MLDKKQVFVAIDQLTSTGGKTTCTARELLSALNADPSDKSIIETLSKLLDDLRRDSAIQTFKGGHSVDTCLIAPHNFSDWAEFGIIPAGKRQYTTQ